MIIVIVTRRVVKLFSRDNIIPISRFESSQWAPGEDIRIDKKQPFAQVRQLPLLYYWRWICNDQRFA